MADRAAGGVPDAPVRRRLHQLPTAAVVATLVTGIAGITVDHWRKGAEVVGGAALLAALLRLLLPARESGPLAVRSRAFDTLMYLAVGAAVVAIAHVVPTYYHHHL